MEQLRETQIKSLSQNIAISNQNEPKSQTTNEYH